MELGLCFVTNQTVLCGQAKDLLKPADRFSLFVVIQSLSHVHLFATPWSAVCQSSLSFTILCSLLKLMSIELVMPSKHVVLCHPLLLLLQSFPASGSFPVSQLFESGDQSIGTSASVPVLPMNIQDWFPLGLTSWSPCCPRDSQKSSLKPSSKATILWHSAFFIGQLSHPYMTTGKTIALTIQIFADKVMSLLFGMLSRFFIAFLLRSKSLLISWLQSASTVILES